MAKKLDENTKTKLIYSGELLFFSLVFFTLGILEMVNVINISDRYKTIFNWVTIFGGTWIIIDFIWTLCSKKRRAKSSLVDKFMLIPLGPFLITYDLISLINNVSLDYDYYRFGMGGIFLYVGLTYFIQAFYHYKHPIPGLLD